MIRTSCRYPKGPLLYFAADLDVEDVASEEVQHLADARVVLAEYDVLQHDFPELQADNLALRHPHLRDLAAARRDEAIKSIIDEWLVANAAYVSTAQAAQAVVNTTIHTDGRRAIAYRPPKYGRAAVVPVQGRACVEGPNHRSLLSTKAGLLDLKGVGVSPDRVPANGRQSSGLEYLGLALSDFLIKKAIDDILARALPTVWTVPVYAVLDLGFDVVGGFHGTGPAGMHVRRAHRRRVAPQIEPVEHAVTFEIESVLRRYGITAATRGLQLHIAREGGRVTWQVGRTQPFTVKDPQRIGVSLALLHNVERLTLDRRDVQLAREVSWPPAEAQMVDFGALRVERCFECPTIRRVDRPAVDEIMWPADQHFIQPDPELQLPVEKWNRRELATLCFNLANEFRRNAISPADLRRELDDRLLGLVDRWSERA